jgi:hypothetical protein
MTSIRIVRLLFVRSMELLGELAQVISYLVHGMTNCRGMLAHSLARSLTYMSIEDLNYMRLFGPKADLGTGNTFAKIPIAPEESRWPSVQRIGHHGALLDGPSRQNGQAGAETAAMIELAIRENQAGLTADAPVVFLRAAFLQSDDVSGMAGRGNAPANLSQPLITELGNVFQTPAVDSNDANFLGDSVHTLLPVGNGGRCHR